MDDDILIEVKLDTKEAERAADTIGRKLQKSLNTAMGGNASGATRAIKDQETAALRLAQAQARLATASGNLTGAQNILSTALSKTNKESIAQINAQTQLVRVQNRMEGSTRQVASGVGALRGAFSALAAIGVVSLFEQFGRAALSAAISVDRQVTALTALTGSAAAAEKRFAQLFALAQKTPGLTTNLAATLDAQLRVFNVNVQTIDRLLPVIGRLNAISPLGDPRQFVNNLTQLITQNFERQDLKELVGQSPIAGQLIKEIFNVDNPTNAEAIRTAAKRLGVTTVDRLAEEFIKAGANNTALKNAVESIGGQFEKLRDRAQIALAPIGREIAAFLIPTLERIIPLAEDFGRTLTQALRDNRDEIAQFSNAVADLASAFTALGKISIPILGTLAQSAANTVGFVADLANAARGDTSFKNSRANFGNFFRDSHVVDPSLLTGPEDLEAAGITRAGAGSQQFRSLAEFLANRPIASRVAGAGRITGGGGAGRTRPRFVNDFGLGQTAELEHEIELARIRRANLAVVARRRALPKGIGLPTVPLTAPGTPGVAEFPGQELALLTKAADELERLPHLLSDSERFMRGFKSAVETTGDAFERFGANVAIAFGNVRDLFNGLKQAVLGFFNDLLGNALQNLVRQTLGGIFGGGGGGAGLGGLFGNLFRTPAFAGGDGITVPPSITQSIGGGGRSGGLGDFIGASVPRTAGSVASGGGFSLGGLFGGLASAAPLLGLGLGSGFGGQSVAGQILGAIGGGAVGLGASFGAAVFGAGGGLAQAGLAALGPIGLIGVPLLIGASLLGKAKQRRADEEASGQFLTQALQGIEQLAQAAAAGQFRNIGEARSLFESQIIGAFVQQINTLKTKSVRESRLTNQVRDLRNVFEARIPPLVSQSEARAATRAANAAAFAQMVPQFATGGTTIGGLALLHPGEKVLNLAQQQRVIAQSNPQVFERAGVPGPSSNRVFDVGGTMGAGLPEQPINITLEAQVVISEKTATGIFVVGGRTDSGRVVTVNNVKAARLNKEL